MSTRTSPLTGGEVNEWCSAGLHTCTCIPLDLANSNDMAKPGDQHQSTQPHFHASKGGRGEPDFHCFSVFITLPDNYVMYKNSNHNYTDGY